MRVRSMAAILAGLLPMAGCTGGNKGADEGGAPAPAQGASVATVVAASAQPVPSVTAKRNVVYVLDMARAEGPIVKVEGWAFLDTDPANPKKPLDARGSEIYVVLAPSAGAPSMYHTDRIARPDISKAYGPNLDDSGFRTAVAKGSLNRGTYRVGLYVRRDAEEALTFSDKLVTIN
jgi:hypothetical protein